MFIKEKFQRKKFEQKTNDIKMDSLKCWQQTH